MGVSTRSEFIIIVSVCLIFEWFLRINSSPVPDVHVDGYKELEEPFYPFQQYIQVRKSVTVEHVPAYDDNDNAGSTSSTKKDHYQASPSDQESHQDEYVVPRLREEVQDWKKQEVYEEKGYGDSAFDHDTYRFSGEGRGNYEPSQSSPGQNSDEYQQQASSHVGRPSASHESTSRRPHYSRRLYDSLHNTPDGSATKLLDYVASLHDRELEAKGPYAARDHIYCPEVIDFDLSSKSMKMGEGGRGGARPRLSGLGSKINCLKSKYFGNEPLPSAIFHSPSEAQDFVIDSPSFDKFYDMVRQGVDFSSPYQNSNMPDFRFKK